MTLRKIKNYSQLEKILENSSWQSFEKIVGKIFDLHGYEVKVSEVVTFENTKRQYDVIAEKKHLILADCKKWDNKRRIKYGLEKAVEDQIDRAKKFEFEKNKYPIIVISCHSPIELHKKVPIIPVHKLNDFVLNFQIHKERILRL